jgi:predicted GH43/DUF377 family glycosyl hydrolase
LAYLIEPWGNLKIGAGVQPDPTRHGWIIVYDGVHEMAGSTASSPEFCYSAGVVFLSIKDPQKILYRSFKPIFSSGIAGRNDWYNQKRCVSNRD